MISVQEKLDIFRQELSQRIQDERKSEIEKAKEQAEFDLEKTEEYVQRQENEIKERYQLLEDRNIGRILAQADNTSKEEILITRKKIGENFIQAVENSLKELRTSELYKTFLKTNVERLKTLFKNKTDIILYVLEDERETVEKIVVRELPEKKIIYRTLPVKQIGGFFARDLDERVNYDFSLLNLVDDNNALISSSLEKALNGNK